MFEYFYDWMQNIAFYMILVMAVVQILPNTGYKKYIRFFTGLVLILMLAVPIFKIFGMDKHITDIYNNEAYQEELKKIEDATTYLKDVDASEYLNASEKPEGEGKEEGAIEVEEIHIGR